MAGDSGSGEVFRASLLTSVLRLHRDLLHQVEKLEGNPEPGAAHDALVTAMELLCQDLREFVSYRFARVQDVVGPRRPRTSRRRSGVLADRNVQADLEMCHRIGRGLASAMTGPRPWDVEREFVAVYKKLAGQVAGRPQGVSRRQLPGALGKFRKRACALAAKSRTGTWSGKDEKTARNVLRRGLAFTIAFGALVGLEQDIVPFSKDVAAVVVDLVHIVTELADEGSELVLPVWQVGPPAPARQEPAAEPPERHEAEPPRFQAPAVFPVKLEQAGIDLEDIRLEPDGEGLPEIGVEGEKPTMDVDDDGIDGLGI